MMHEMRLSSSWRKNPWVLDLSWIPEGWSAKVNGWNEKKDDLESQGRIEVLLRIPFSERQWSFGLKAVVQLDFEGLNTKPLLTIKATCASSIMQEVHDVKKAAISLSVPAFADSPPKISKKVVQNPVVVDLVEPSRKRKKGILMEDVCLNSSVLDLEDVADGTVLVNAYSEPLGKFLEDLYILGNLVMQNVTVLHDVLGCAMMMGHWVRNLEVEAARSKEDFERALKISEDALTKEKKDSASRITKFVFYNFVNWNIVPSHMDFKCGYQGS